MTERDIDPEKQAASGIQSQYNICPIWSDKHSASIILFISWYYLVFSCFNVTIGILVGIPLLMSIDNISNWAIGILIFCCFEPLCHSIGCCANRSCDCGHIDDDNRPYRGFLRIITILAMIYTFIILSMYYLEKQTLAHIEVIINIIYFAVCAHTFMLNYFLYMIYIPFWKYIMAPVCRVIGHGIHLCCPYILRCLRFTNNICN